MSRIRGRKITNDSGSNNAPAPAAGSVEGGRKKQKTINFDDHIDSDQESDYDEGRGFNNDNDDDVEEEETLDAKKVRLAREYLQKLESKDQEIKKLKESVKQLTQSLVTVTQQRDLALKKFQFMTNILSPPSQKN